MIARRKIVVSLVAAAAGLLWFGQARASVAPGLYGVGPFLVGSQFLKFDTTTGAATAVGPTHWDEWSGITLDQSGRILGLTFNGDVHEIDPTTGLAGPTLVQMSIRTFYEGDFAINTATGQAYGTWGSSLLSLDLGTGQAVMSNPMTYQGTWLDSQANIDGLSFRNGDLYGFVTVQQPGLNGHLIRIDPATLTVTDVGATGLAFAALAGMAYDPQDDIFYIAGKGLPGLYSLNPLTGAATLIGNTGQAEISGMVYVVPEPAGAIGLAGLGVLALHRPRIVRGKVSGGACNGQR